jgi:hypothetical protein
MVSISKKAQNFFRAFALMHFYRPLRTAAALQWENKLWCWCSSGLFWLISKHTPRAIKSSTWVGRWAQRSVRALFNGWLRCSRFEEELSLELFNFSSGGCAAAGVLCDSHCE